MTNLRLSNFQTIPPVVKNLMIINAIVLFFDYFLAQRGIDLSRYLGLHYFSSQLFRPWQILTHLFMHGDLRHLLSNMLALYLFGCLLENVWGSKRFLIFYLVCGIGAAFCHLAVLGLEFSSVEKAFTLYQQNPTVDQFAKFITQHVAHRGFFDEFLQAWQNNPGNPQFRSESSLFINQYLHGGYDTERGVFVKGIMDVATVGASGAVFGVLFAFGYYYPNTELPFYFSIKAKYLVGLYALFELFNGFKNSAGDNVAHFAHLGGMLFAFLLIKYWQKTIRNSFF